MKTNSRYLADVLITAVAPAIWGSTYFVTTSFLPHGYPLTSAMLRALPAGLLLLLIVRKLPTGVWWGRAFILGALNFSFFWAMLFVSAYRLPGGVAATVGAVQPLIVIALSRLFLGKPIRFLAVIAGLIGMSGVALLVLTPNAALDPVGIAAGLAGAVSMAFGTVLTRHWQPPVSSLTFTSWQLTAGGILLVPVAFLLEPALPAPTPANMLGIAYLGLIGAAFTYLLWFRGLSRIEPSAAASLGFLSPVVATLLGWLALGQSLSPAQIAGFAMVLASVWLSQRTMMPVRPTRPAASREPASHPA
ncbi:DMT superfamily inner membrane transporter protein [Rhizobium phaseoli]|uniref:DMT superfamily inner membrane transporter protein n=2 Tax=Rhizobium TaxID=379 RepID=A0A192T586_9HYPH|nr:MULTISPECIES: EamA family transporter [Rhizobium]ACE89310.1 putative transporter, permease protein [Rhizobium etli CIAT 652]MDH6647292.1 putative blue pigment (indigoidine) exporter [Rhizobium esperanzae]ANL26198.1 DMT superfamily inner membrane transporter protein [Rhizobium phaseoli]ANL38765.1 DMT superfamily inner membrane transporter protein [Rhizobium phaseoli]ANL51514.1 DMT superfamily inner membrane transporter protein [Rhizobium phaseoli]